MMATLPILGLSDLITTTFLVETHAKKCSHPQPVGVFTSIGLN
jgi:hypothetical protein